MNSYKNKNLSNNLTKTQKNSTKTAIFILFIAIYAFFLLLLLPSLAFYSDNNSASGDIVLAELDFTIFENNVTETAVLPNQTINKTVSVINARDKNGSNYQNLCSFLFRFDFDILIDGEADENLKQQISIVNSSNDFYYDENYFYYLGVLNANQTANLCDAISVSSSVGNNYQNKQMSFVFSIEAIQSQNGAYQEVWIDAPEEWITQISNVL